LALKERACSAVPEPQEKLIQSKTCRTATRASEKLSTSRASIAVRTKDAARESTVVQAGILDLMRRAAYTPHRMHESRGSAGMRA
jgi:hypothetical protein